MSTPGSPISFDQYWQTIQNDAADQQTMITQQEADKTALENKLAGIPSTSDPQLVLLYLLEVVFSSTDPTNNGNIFGVENDQLGITGQSLRTMGDMTLVTDSLQNITNNKGVVPSGTNDVAYFAQSLDKILNALGANPDPSVQTDPALIAALGGNDPSNPTVPTLISDFQQLRGYIYYADDSASGSNPQNACYNTTTDPSTDSTSTALFDPTYGYTGPTQSPPGRIDTFANMIAWMSQKGDPANANTAAEDLSNNFSQTSSATQSANASLNEQVSQITNNNKNAQSWYTSLVKSLIDLVNAIVQNITQKANS